MTEIVDAYDKLEDIRKLFSEYTSMLLEMNPDMQLYLDLQNYQDEAEHPERKYELPWGRLCIAISDGSVAGCVALRRLDDERGELKRLYVRPSFRGKGIGRVLVEWIEEEAREIGYKSLYLDSVPELEAALSLYRKMGFEETEAYNDSPVDSTVFMRKIL